MVRMASGAKYTGTDGGLVLTLEEAEEGGYLVTSPMDPELITEADSLPEAFAMARDALEALAASRAKLIHQFQTLHAESA